MARKGVLEMSDGFELGYYSWIPRKKTRAVVQIVHGMAEHAARYEHLAKALNKAGYSVYGDDHRGHGISIHEPSERGFFSDKDGWDRVIEDTYSLTQMILKEEPDKEIFLLGHSMGSFIVRDLMSSYGAAYSGVVISGTATSPGLLGSIGKIIAKRAVKKSGPRTPNPKLDAMSFGSYNKAFAPNRTKFDWLSRDEAQVDAYIADENCGFICTSQFFVDLLTGLIRVNTPDSAAKVPKQLPLLLVSGSKDPVGIQGKGVEKVFQLYKNSGVEDITLKLFEDARHEICNETNRLEVEQTIISWLEAHTKAEPVEEGEE